MQSLRPEVPSNPKGDSPIPDFRHDQDGGDITRLLRDGERDNADELYLRVRGGLRRIAHRRLGGEDYDPLLQTTLLADDAFLEILRSTKLEVRNRTHLFALASRLMERALRVHARSRKRLKRNGGVTPLPIEEQDDLADTACPVAEASAREMHGVMTDALERLGEHYDSETRDTVVLRRGCGLSVQETADLLGVSERTIKRRTRYGLAWLVKELEAKGYEIGDSAT